MLYTSRCSTFRRLFDAQTGDQLLAVMRQRRLLLVEVRRSRAPGPLGERLSWVRPVYAEVTTRAETSGS